MSDSDGPILYLSAPLVSSDNLISVKQPVDFVESIPGLTHQEREMILCDTPAKLLKID